MIQQTQISWKMLYNAKQKNFNEIEQKTLHKEYASWIKAGGQKYLRIKAPNYFRLGVLEGKFLKKQIKTYNRIIRMFARFGSPQNLTYQKIRSLAIQYFDHIPDTFFIDRGFGTFVDELHGMASRFKRLDWIDMLVQNCFLDITYGHIIPSSKKLSANVEFGCTSFGISPTTNNKINIGQNFDFNALFYPTLAFVHHQVGNDPSIFGLRMGGMLNVPTGMNSHGVIVCVNIIKCAEKGNLTIPSGIRSRFIFTRAKSAEETISMSNSTPQPIGFNLMVSDKQNLYALEISPSKQIIRRVKTYKVSSNTYTSDCLQNKLKLPNYSKYRQKYAEYKLSQIYHSKTNDKELFPILCDTPVINRLPKNPMSSRTLAYFTPNYFGIGSPNPQTKGITPIVRS